MTLSDLHLACYNEYSSRLAIVYDSDGADTTFSRLFDSDNWIDAYRNVARIFIHFIPKGMLFLQSHHLSGIWVLRINVSDFMVMVIGSFKVMIAMMVTVKRSYVKLFFKR